MVVPDCYNHTIRSVTKQGTVVTTLADGRQEDDDEDDDVEGDFGESVSLAKRAKKGRK